MSLPVPLEQADLSRPFVYERQHGVFYVPFGKHQRSMSFLLALQHGCDSGVEVAQKLGLDYPELTADHWLEHTPGAAFRSSVGKCNQIGSSKGMTPLERRLLAPALCVFE